MVGPVAELALRLPFADATGGALAEVSRARGGHMMGATAAPVNIGTTGTPLKGQTMDERHFVNFTQGASCGTDYHGSVVQEGDDTDNAQRAQTWDSRS